jgi:hypothetical protein
MDEGRLMIDDIRDADRFVPRGATRDAYASARVSSDRYAGSYTARGDE